MYTLFGFRGQGAGGYEAPVCVYVNVYIVWVQGAGGYEAPVCVYVNVYIVWFSNPRSE